jgi:tetratricopeptide (TPR) repeat protein
VAIPVRQINPELPAELERIIDKALEKNRSQRYQSAREMQLDLERLQNRLAPARPPLAGKWLAAGTAAVVLLVGSAYWIGDRIGFWRSAPTPVSSSAIKARRSVAVLGFKNLSGNPEKSWLSTALSEMMNTELSQGDQLRTIPGESVAQMRIGLALPDADTFSPPTLHRIRQNLGSDDVIVGSYLPLGKGQLRLDLHLQDAVAGETLASVSEKGDESEIDVLVSRAGAELRAKLGIAALSGEQSALVRASLPSNPEATRLYSLGLEKLRRFDAISARDLLEKAVALDREHAPTYSGLAEAWSVLGYDDKAKEQAKRALEFSSKSSREERFLIEGRSHELLAELPAAIENYRALFQYFPDRVDYGLFLIRAQVANGGAKQAEGTLADLRKLKVSEADAARIDLAEANIAQAQSDFKRAQALAERGANRGRAVGASLLAAQALQEQAEGLELMGQSDKAVQLSAQARELYSSAGDRQGVARTLLFSGDVLFDQGDFDGAKKQLEDSLTVYREIGAQRGIRSALERIGNVLYQQGKLLDAKNYYDQALRMDRDLHSAIAVANDYGNLANVLDSLGDLPGALKMQEQSLTGFNEIGDRRGASTTLNNLGNLDVEMGNLDEAWKHFSESLAMTRQIAYRRGEPYPTSGLGEVLLARGDLAAARKQYEQAIAVCEETKDDDFATQIRTSLSSLALHEGEFSDGETLARQAAAVFDKTNAITSSVTAHALLARNLLSQGNLTEARSAAAQAVTLSRRATGKTAHFEATLADSRVKAKSGKASEARQQLESMLADARSLGYRLYEYQARLALAEIELLSGSASAHSHLADLEEDARGKGFLLVANQARTLR